MGHPDGVRLLARELHQEPDDQPQLLDANPYVGKVTRIDANASMLHFVIPDFSSEVEFGPAKYPRPANRTGEEEGGTGDPQFLLHSHLLRTPTATPPVGTEILVAFIGGDPDRPYVTTVYGWPT